MITLYDYGESIGVADPSPFCLKVHAYMRMSGLPYNRCSKLTNLQKAPKGQLPFIIDNPKNKKPNKLSKKGKLIADSGFIIDYLKQTYQADLDSWLTDAEQANSHLIMKSLEENFYFCLVYALGWMMQDGKQ